MAPATLSLWWSEELKIKKKMADGLLIFADRVDKSYTFHHFIAFLYTLIILLLFTTFGCYQYNFRLVVVFIVIGALPLLISYGKMSHTAGTEKWVKGIVVTNYILIATLGSGVLYFYSENCDIEPVMKEITVEQLPTAINQTNYNYFTLRDGDVRTDFTMKFFVFISDRCLFHSAFLLFLPPMILCALSLQISLLSALLLLIVLAF